MRDSHNILSFQRENNAAAEREGGWMRKRKGRGWTKKSKERGRVILRKKEKGKLTAKLT